MANKDIPHRKFLFICGFTCAVCGLIIFVVSFLDHEPVSYGTISMGLINIINGCLFLSLSRPQNNNKE